MPLQTGRLTLLAIGVQNDQPPNALQPQLADGIHLRWASHPDVGLPWGGYFLLRRPHRPAREICWTRMWAERKLGAGSTVDSPLATPLGIFASDRPIRFVDDFPAAGQAELDLAGRSSLVLVFPPVLKGAYRVTARIGFRCDEANKLVEVPLGDRIRAPGATHLRPTRRLDVQAHRRGRFRPAVRTRNEHGSGVLAGSRARVLPGRPASAVRVDLSQSGASTLRAIDTKGNEVSRQTTRGTGLHTVELTGVRIATVIVESLADDVVIHNVAVLRDEECARETTVIVTAWSGDHVVARAEVSGRAGEVVDVELRADFMSHVVFSEAPAAVVELCVQAVDSELAGGWKPVPGTPCPFVLPVAHPDYTPPGRPTDFASARSLAMGRIAYGPTTNWDSGFGDLHATLETLVAGGPGSTPMNQRSAPVPSDDDPAVRMPGQNPLSLVNLAALHPAAAQLLGLYWNDEDVSSGQRWDYAVVADHGSRFRGDCDAVAAWLDAGAKGLDDVDVFVVRDRTLGGDPPPVAPIEIESFALPGAGWTDTAAGPIQTYLAGLTWQDPPPGPRAPAGGASVMFHIWRQDMPVEPTPAPTPASSDSFALVSANPVLRSMPTPTTTPQPQGPSDWPPDRMLGLDRVDAEGWFSYRISGIDLFGRHTQHSEAASWSTWAPPPAQLPWYWERADADGLVHPSAVALLDKEAPPPPMGITANLLDPHDPHLVRDAAYETWRASLPDAVRDDLVGLRIRFVWSAQLAAQAPDARSFGSTTPPDAEPTTSARKARPAIGRPASTWSPSPTDRHERVPATSTSSSRPLPMRRPETLSVSSLPPPNPSCTEK